MNNSSLIHQEFELDLTIQARVDSSSLVELRNLAGISVSGLSSLDQARIIFM